MPTLDFSVEQLQKYFSDKYFHKTYNETVKLYYANKVHSDGDFPAILINERRPSESMTAKKYRRLIWEPITMPEWGKVIICLNKIRRSSDWSIKFDPATVPAFLQSSGQSLAQYLEKDFPHFSSLTNWLFSVLLPAQAKDANAWVCTYPLREDVAPTELVRPYPVIFHSDQVIDYIENDFVVLKSSDKAVFYQQQSVVPSASIGIQQGEPKASWGDVYYIITTQTVQRWKQRDNTRGFELDWDYNHGLNRLPAHKIKGLLKKTYEGATVFDSRLSGMVPKFNEAVREYSDLQAAKVRHMFPKEWEMGVEDCGTCKGTGEVKIGMANNTTCQCHTCHGTGAKSRGPYTTLMLKAPMPGEAALPTPPAGYIESDNAIIKIQIEEVDNHLFSGLSACQMQFLMQAPLNVSGKKAEVDQDGLNTFVNFVAEDMVAVADLVALDCCDIRYIKAVPNEVKRRAMLPTISVPEKYDILSADYLETGLKSAVDNRVNPAIVNELTIQYANKKFADNPKVRDRVALMIALDPFAGVSEEDKMVRFDSGFISKVSAVVSANLQEYIDQAIDEKGDAFFAMTTKEKKALMREYATAHIAETSPVNVVLNDVMGEAVAGGGNTLKDSVGGLTGMIEIAKAVASGLYDLDAAVALVSDRFGLSEEAARKQLGTPSINTTDAAIDKVAKLV